MNTPPFWEHDGPLPALLTPLSLAWRAAMRLRARRESVKVTVPVICVGNVVAGGAGKTPTVHALHALLTGMGWKPAILSRGYGGRLKGPAKVDPATHTAADVGDEALLHTAFGPCWIARERAAGALAAVEDGARLVLMDDGFQNPALHKDLSFLVLDGAYGLGNGRLLPAGPLREPLENALTRAQAVVMLGHDDHHLRARIPLPIFDATLEADAQAVQRLRDRKILAFAGIARPEKFFNTLRATHLSTIKTRRFADHHPYTPAELNALVKEAEQNKLHLVTTTKDMARIPPEFRTKISALPVHVRWKDEPALTRFLRGNLPHA